MTNLSVLRGYLECALWSSNDDGGPLDRSHTINDIAWEAVIQAAKDVDAFMAACDFLDLGHDGHGYESVGHDLWLTRNGHGAGYWDGDYPVHGNGLTTLARGMGEVDLYVGDDGLVYMTP